jgi:NADPH-dependent curcumin reductase CurA
VLVRHHFLSLDPYMRGRMNDAKSYAQPQALGQTMGGGTVGEVAESRHPKFAVGDKVVGMGGWQEYSVVDATQPGALRKVDTTHVPLSAYLGAVGMPGVTAWYGLVKIIEPKAGSNHGGQRGYRCRRQRLCSTVQGTRLPHGGHCGRPGQMQIRGGRTGL